MLKQFSTGNKALNNLYYIQNATMFSIIFEASVKNLYKHQILSNEPENVKKCMFSTQLVEL